MMERLRKLFDPMASVVMIAAILSPMVAVSMVETGAVPLAGTGMPAAGALGSSQPAPLPEDEARARPEGVCELMYDLGLRIEVTGSMTLLTRTRYYRSEDLHLNLLAVPSGRRWQFRTQGLREGKGELNFGIGEGPRKHQRYVLLASRPTEDEKGLIEQRILAEEVIRGCAVDGSRLDPDRGDGQAADGVEVEEKKAFFNYYLWQDPGGAFSFWVTPSGRISQVENRVELEEFLREGGSKVNPRFFETLQFLLEAIPSFLGPANGTGQGAEGENQWEVSCRPVLEGLVALCEGAYGRNMTLLEPETLDEQKARYRAHPVPATSILRVQGVFDQPVRTPVRISGFKGEIWLESLQREVYFDTLSGRVLKDELDLSFGVERDKTMLAISGSRNRVRISLVDRCFLARPDTDDGIRAAYRECAGLSTREAGSCR